jgi:hypothetical protein
MHSYTLLTIPSIDNVKGQVAKEGPKAHAKQAMAGWTHSFSRRLVFLQQSRSSWIRASGNVIALASLGKVAICLRIEHVVLHSTLPELQVSGDT